MAIAHSQIVEKRNRMRNPLQQRRLLAILLLTAIALSQVVPSIALADGGAPNRAYISGSSKGVSVIDVPTQKVIDQFDIPGNPEMMQLSVDGRYLYVVQTALGKFSIIAARNHQNVCSANVGGHPNQLVLDSGTNLLYVASSDSNGISAFSTNDCTLKHTISAQGHVHGLAIAMVGSGFSGGSGNLLWVADDQGIGIYDSSGKANAQIPIAGGADRLTIPLGDTVYATTQQGDVLAIGVANRTVLPPLFHGGPFGPMDYDAITGQVFIPDIGKKQIDILTPVNIDFVPPEEPRKVIKLQSVPKSIAITSDGQLGFIAQGNGQVVMLDVPGQKQIASINVGGTPHFIITGLNPPIVGTTPQQTNNIGLIANITAYILVAALIIVPILIFLRINRKKGTKPDEKQQIG